MIQEYVEFSPGDVRLVKLSSDVPESLFGWFTWWEFCTHCDSAYRTNSSDVVFVKYRSNVLPSQSVILIPRHEAVCRGMEHVPFIRLAEPREYVGGEEASKFLYREGGQVDGFFPSKVG